VGDLEEFDALENQVPKKRKNKTNSLKKRVMKKPNEFK